MGGEAQGAAVEPGGLSLGRYAAVKAALAEPIPASEALDAHGIDAGAWDEADLGWTAHLVDDGRAGGRDLAAYRAELAAAEDALSRRVTPLDDDISAWVGFLNAFTRSEAPLELLRGADLGMNDVSRLTRRWARRLEKDAALRDRAAALAKTPGAAPTISVEPRAHIRPRETGARGDQAADFTGTAGHEGLERYAALQAELAAFPGEAPRTQRRHGIAGDAELTALDERWRARFGGDPSLERDYRALRAHASRQLAQRKAPPGAEGPAEAPASPPPAVCAAAGPERDSTQDVSAFFEAGHALPFGPAGSLGAASLAVSRPTAASSSSSAGGTVDASAAWERGPALPFAREEAGPPPAVRKAVGTVDVSEAFASGEALPFSPAPPAPPAPSDVGPSSAPAVVDLSLQQYASLCVELHAHPHRRAETLARYHLTAESGAALDGAFRARIAGDQALAAAFARDYAAYKAWLSSTPVPPPAAPPAAAPATKSGTVDVSDAFSAGLALPFGAAPPAPSAPPPPAPASPSATGTADVSDLFSAGLALPFGAALPPPPAPPPPPPPASPALGTVDVSDAFSAGLALPFKQTSPAPPAPPPPAPLSLEQYASLSVELAQAPARSAETLRRYGLTAADKDRLDAQWRGRLTDAGTLAAFEQACAAYRSWLLRR